MSEANEVTVKQAALDLGFKAAKPFIDLAKRYYPMLAGSWKASTKIPVEMVQKLKEKAEEFENLNQLIESSSADEEENDTPEPNHLALASGSPYEGLSCQSSADALSMVRNCSTALEYAFTSFNQVDFLYLYEAATNQAIAEHKVYTSVKAHVAQKLREADTEDKLKAIKLQSQTIQQTADKMLADAGVSPIEETLGNGQRSAAERTEEAKKRVSELAMAVQLSCNSPL